jgi:general secretion pathway protein L
MAFFRHAQAAPAAPSQSPSLQSADLKEAALLLPPGWPQREGEIHWWWRDDTGAHAARASGLPPELRGARLHVWTPGTDTLLTTTTLPTQSRAKIAQALPFALEDQLLGEPEATHFAHRPLANGRIAVAITARERLEGWLHTLGEADLHPASLCPAPLAVPYVEGRWTAVAFEDELWVRTAPLSGFACPLPAAGVPGLLMAALSEARANARAPEEIIVFNMPAQIDEQAWAAVLGLSVGTQLLDLSVQMTAPPPFNLLQAEFAPLARWRKLAGALRPAAVMLAILLIGSLMFTVGEWWHLNSTAQQQREEMMALFRKSFPEARVVVDPALQMQRNLAALRARSGTAGAGDLLPLLTRTGPVLRAHPEAGLARIQYADGALTLELSLPSFQALDALKAALAGAGLRVEVVAANSRAAGVESRLRVLAGEGA